MSKTLDSGHTTYVRLDGMYAVRRRRQGASRYTIVDEEGVGKLRGSPEFEVVPVYIRKRVKR